MCLFVIFKASRYDMHYIYSTHLLHDAMRGLDTAHKQQMMNNVLGYVSSMLLNNTRSISCSPICAISMSIIPENDVRSSFGSRGLRLRRPVIKMSVKVLNSRIQHVRNKLPLKKIRIPIPFES